MSHEFLARLRDNAARVREANSRRQALNAKEHARLAQSLEWSAGGEGCSSTVLSGLSAAGSPPSVQQQQHPRPIEQRAASSLADWPSGPTVPRSPRSGEATPTRPRGPAAGRMDPRVDWPAVGGRAALRAEVTLGLAAPIADGWTPGRSLKACLASELLADADARLAHRAALADKMGANVKGGGLRAAGAADIDAEEPAARSQPLLPRVGEWPYSTPPGASDLPGLGGVL